MKLFVALFTLLPLVFFGVGGYMVWNQHHKITTYRPVAAEVLSKDIEVHRSRNSDGRTSTSYKPIVEYRYQVDGTTHECDVVTPLDESATQGWARETINRYQVGQQTEAYYNPDDPDEAFLIKQYSFFPYIFLLSPMVFLSIGIGAGVGVGIWRKKGDPWPVAGDWFELQPTTRIRDRRSGVLMVATLWYVVGVLVCGHYFRAAEPPYGLFALIPTIVYALLGLVPVAMFVYYIRLGRSLADAYLLIDTQRPTLGESLTVHVEQDVYTGLHVNELTIALVCEETRKYKSRRKTTISSSTCWEERVPVIQDYQTGPGETLTAEHTFHFPEGAKPTSPPRYKPYPRHAWRVEVATDIPNHPDYSASFPVIVEGPDRTYDDSDRDSVS